MNSLDNYMVSILCFTFNHSRYIKEALDGVCNQKTNFPYVCIVLDDASTDGEQQLLKEYVGEYFNEVETETVKSAETDDYQLIFAQNKVNHNCYFAVFLLKYNHFKKKNKEPYYSHILDKSKYIAICEGDDFWTDENKLAYQVCFLESHQDFSMCFHRAEIKKESPDLKVAIDCETIEDREYSADEIFARWIVPTASILHRRDVTIKVAKNFLHSDIIRILSCAESGRIMGSSRCMSIYRVNASSVTQNTSLQDAHCLSYPNHVRAIHENFSSVSKPAYKKLMTRRLFQRAFLYKRKSMIKCMLADLIEAYKVSIYYACRETLKLFLGYPL